MADQLSALHYNAIDNSSSSLLSRELSRAASKGREYCSLYTTNGWLVSVPAWAITCALAEREEEEGRLGR